MESVTEIEEMVKDRLVSDLVEACSFLPIMISLGEIHAPQDLLKARVGTDGIPTTGC